MADGYAEVETEDPWAGWPSDGLRHDWEPIRGTDAFRPGDPNYTDEVLARSCPRCCAWENAPLSEVADG